MKANKVWLVCSGAILALDAQGGHWIWFGIIGVMILGDIIFNNKD